MTNEKVCGYACVGTDDLGPVIWGVGNTEQEAREDAARELEVAPAALAAARVVPLTLEQCVAYIDVGLGLPGPEALGMVL